jgi:hypothetical protein
MLLSPLPQLLDTPDLQGCGEALGQSLDGLLGEEVIGLDLQFRTLRKSIKPSNKAAHGSASTIKRTRTYRREAAIRPNKKPILGLEKG